MQKVSISFPTRKTKDGNYQIQLSVSSNYQRATKNLRHFCVTKKPQRKSLLKELEIIKLDVQNTIRQMESLGIETTPRNIIDCYENGVVKTERKTLESVFNEFSIPLKERISKKTFSRYKLVFDTFSTIFDKNSPISDINRGHIEQYKSLIESKYKNETAISHWKKLKSIIRYAIDCGYIKSNPFISTSIKREKKKIDYLTKDEIEILKNAKLENKSLQNMVDCALFQIASGLSYSDLKNLTKEDLQMVDGAAYINKERLKTNNTFVSYVLPMGIDIWKKHNGNLPVISNQKYNTYLKTVQDILGIKTTLHTHLFRHTYATLLLNSGVPIHIVQKALGHTSVLITQQYYAHLEDLTVINTIKNAVK